MSIVTGLVVVHPAGRRLKNRLPGCSKVNIDNPKGNIRRHRLLVHEAHTGGYSAKETAWKVITINKERKAYMHHPERICRKIKCCRIPLLPEALIWIRCVQVYHSLLWCHKGKIKTCGKLKRSARWCNIPNPLSLSFQETTLRLETCKTECAFYQEHGKQFCQKNL